MASIRPRCRAHTYMLLHRARPKHNDFDALVFHVFEPGLNPIWNCCGLGGSALCTAKRFGEPGRVPTISISIRVLAGRVPLASVLRRSERVTHQRCCIRARADLQIGMRSKPQRHQHCVSSLGQLYCTCQVFSSKT